MKLRIDHGEKKSYLLWCPGCEDTHRVNDMWEFNGDDKMPTFTPSILVRRPASPNASEKYKKYRVAKVCHSFVTAGEWHYLTDSTHHLAGQTVPMVDLPDWLTL